MALNKYDYAAIQAGRAMAAAYQGPFNDAFRDRNPKPTSMSMVPAGIRGAAGGQGPSGAPGSAPRIMPPSAAQISRQHAQNLRRNAERAGPSMAGLSTNAVANEAAQRMRLRPELAGGDRQIRLDQQRRLRTMTADQRAAVVDQEVLRNEAAIPLDGGGHRVDLRNPVGSTYDEQYQMDRQFYAPGTQAILDSARKKFREEFAGLMTSGNKQAFATMDDFNDAVNGLGTVRRYGPLIENYVRQLAVSSISPAMQAQFEANDRTVSSFVEWYKGNVETGDMSDAEIADLYRSDKAARQAFDGDINAVKYEPDPAGKGIRERQASPEQVASAKMRFEMDAQRQQMEADSDATDRWLAGDPQRQELYMKGPDGRPMPKPKVEPTPEQQAQEAARAKRLQMEAEQAEGIAEPKENAAAVKERRARTRQATGEPVPADADGNPVLPGDDDYESLVERRYYRDNILLPAKEKDKADRTEVVLRKGVKAWGKQGGEPAVPPERQEALRGAAQRVIDNPESTPQQRVKAYAVILGRDLNAEERQAVLNGEF